MPETDIDSAVASGLSTAVTDFSVDTQETEGALDQKETTWTNTKWPQYLGYYKEIPELRAAIDAKATWTVGKGFKADPDTTLILDGIRGWGKDTFNTILENMIRVMMIAGNAYAEVIRDDKGELINLKPLDPGVMRHVANRKGMIIRFEQTSKVKGGEKKFQPEEIFYLARNRVADEIHGVSLIESMETIILMRNEAMADLQKVFHRYVKPFNIFHLDTDDTTQIAAFKAKQDSITENVENMYIPKGAVEVDRQSIPQFSTLNPLPWIAALNKYFYQATGGTDIVIGGSEEFTEATAKIKYLAFQQNVEELQLQIEEQIGMQLGLEMELEFPASLEHELLSDKAKDVQSGAAQPTDTTATIEGET